MLETIDGPGIHYVELSRMGLAIKVECLCGVTYNAGMSLHTARILANSHVAQVSR